jgi:arylsulfatase
MKSVVLVTFDSFRFDYCGFAGYDRDTTPTLGRMAEEGLVLDTTRTSSGGPRSGSTRGCSTAPRMNPIWRGCSRRGCC